MSEDVPRVFSYNRSLDDRGYFATVFPHEVLSLLNLKEIYISVSMTREKHTIRGMHYQKSPFEEAKLLSVLQGSIVDVLIDLRSLKKGTKRIFSFALRADQEEVLYIPKGFAHGYQTLCSNTQILYALDSRYEPSHCDGYSPLSEDLEELWPFKPSIIQKRDLQWPVLP
jgi:dTDP-4-dehydrorhamnose 3,5-epimerase